MLITSLSPKIKPPFHPFPVCFYSYLVKSSVVMLSKASQRLTAGHSTEKHKRGRFGVCEERKAKVEVSYVMSTLTSPTMPIE